MLYCHAVNDHIHAARRNLLMIQQEQKLHRKVGNILHKVRIGMSPIKLVEVLGKPVGQYPDYDTRGFNYVYKAADGTVALTVGRNPYPAAGSIPMQLLSVAYVLPTVGTMRSFVWRGERVHTLKEKIALFSLGHDVIYQEKPFVRHSYKYNWIWYGTDGFMMLWIDPKKKRIVRYAVQPRVSAHEEMAAPHM